MTAHTDSNLDLPALISCDMYSVDNTIKISANNFL